MTQSTLIWHLLGSQKNLLPGPPSYLTSLGPPLSLSDTQCLKSFVPHCTLTLPQKTLYFYMLYCPLLKRKNKLTDSLFFEQFPDLLEHHNSLAGNPFILGDFNFHQHCPWNPDTSWMNNLLTMFNLQQSMRLLLTVSGLATPAVFDHLDVHVWG